MSFKFDEDKHTPAPPKDDLTSDSVMTADDFFQEFEKEKEVFEIPEEKTETKENLFEEKETTKAEVVMTATDKREMAKKVFDLADNGIDWIGNLVSGKDELGRYKADSMHREVLITNIAELLPDNFVMPKWIGIVLVVAFAYGPVISRISADRKETIADHEAEQLRKQEERRQRKKQQQAEKEQNKKESETKKEE